MENQRIRRLFTCFAAFLASSALFGQTSELQIKTESGTVEGKQAGPVRIFLGIPYAAPPVGDMRWKPPAPPAQWTGIRKATEFGHHCMQGPIYGDMTFHDAGGSEDCLSLNVWTPAKSADAKLPVMVWIHGGGFVAGTSSEDRQNGEHLAQQGVVVVSMNYRLSIFGFLALPELAKESGRNAAGNYGLLDQLAALRWVHENIAAFGGDAGNVTIFGESAGSFSVSALMASPLAKGLLHKAIGESGAAFSNEGMPFEPLAERQEKDTKTVDKTFGVHTLAELRALPAQKLLDPFANMQTAFAFGPDVDGYFLPESAVAIFVAGKQSDVPLLAGWNRDEGSFEMAFSPAKPVAESMKATAEKEFGAKSAEFLRLYPTGSDAQAERSLEDFTGDRFIAFSTWKWIEAQTATGKQPVYRYRFDLAPPEDKGPEPQLGAYHSADIEYVFGQLDSKTRQQMSNAPMKWRAQDRQLSAEMQKYWANFARSGDPNGAGLPKWPAYSSGSGWQVMHLDEHSEARKDEQRERYLFLDAEWGK